MEERLSLFSYFRSPFPSREGFSAYRMPGALVHGPLILTTTLAGFFLCWPHPVLRPLLIIWVLAGVYLGRDITILCHYNPLLTLLSWAAFAVVLVNPARLASFGRSHFTAPAILSAILGAIVLLVAFAKTLGVASTSRTSH
jgi:hypothetical protein